MIDPGIAACMSPVSTCLCVCVCVHLVHKAHVCLALECLAASGLQPTAMAEHLPYEKPIY